MLSKGGCLHIRKPYQISRPCMMPGAENSSRLCLICCGLGCRPSSMAAMGAVRSMATAEVVSVTQCEGALRGAAVSASARAVLRSRFGLKVLKRKSICFVLQRESSARA